MKKKLTLLFVVVCQFAIAQPVILNGNNCPAAGGGAFPVYQFNPSSSYSGASGANQTWNFSTTAFHKIAEVSFVNPATTPYGSTYSAANNCAEILDTMGNSLGMYNYRKISSIGIEQIANNVSSNSSTATIYTNYETELPFPFLFQQIDTDYFQKSSGSLNSVILTYDAYGTLILPWGTYNNVVRVNRYWGVNDYGYEWWSTNPLLNILSYDNQSLQFTAAGNAITTGVNQLASTNNLITVFPNPTSDFLYFNAPNNCVVKIYDMLGRTLMDKTLSENKLDVSELHHGVYFFKIFQNEKILSTSKINKQ